ncbi:MULTISPECIES: AAA family ATPase [Thermomonospora]|uniref:AAA ATPase n=1 Tax=Thermomonospora curvata (strain ATCC 19995 / DSM 43183 / JCM 3096 / KCTC 9072 / NBRC 15933 / NCIMB 10081 / Henssen B9) TaxID=471852 RepID=D1ACT7_THECD|nr:MULTISPECIES: P-loop NTPase [Thermomonospora]ACY97426.1 AAA ATPase [Thermomonospora curvata DSM 43183]PKK14776.1 MAG: chromosome partitioning protein [Thermomonospora sp. CIF 1]
MPIVCEPDGSTARRLVAGFREHGRTVADLKTLEQMLAADPDELIVVFGPGAPLEAVLSFAAARRFTRPSLGVVLVRTALEVNTLAQAMRAGIREVVPDRDFPALMEACKRCWEVSSRLRAAEQAQLPEGGAAGPGKDGTVVVLFAGKGGCGKSMVSTNLAVALARRERQVCLVDLDLAFGDVGIMLQLSPQRTIVDAVPMGQNMDQTGVRSLLVRHESGVHAVLAPVAPGDAEKITGRLVTDLLAVLRQMFDVVIVDTPSQFSETVLAALDAADRHLLLAGPEVTALKALRVTLDMLDLLGYPAAGRKILLNRADVRAGLSRSDIDRVAGRPVNVRIPSSSDIPASINKGVPLALSHPGHQVSRAIEEVADLVLGEERRPPGRLRRRGGLRRAKAGR